MQAQQQPNNRKDQNVTLRKLILTGSLMANALETGQQIDKALATNWEHLLDTAREKNLLGYLQRS